MYIFEKNVMNVFQVFKFKGNGIDLLFPFVNRHIEKITIKRNKKHLEMNRMEI